MSRRSQRNGWILDFMTGEAEGDDQAWFRVVLTTDETRKVRLPAGTVGRQADSQCDCASDCACQPGETTEE